MGVQKETGTERPLGWKEHQQAADHREDVLGEPKAGAVVWWGWHWPVGPPWVLDTGSVIF